MIVARAPRAALAAALTAVLLAACGGGDEGPDTGTPPPTSGTDEPVPTGGGPTPDATDEQSSEVTTGPGSPSSGTGTTTTTTPAEPQEVTIGAAGDILPHSRVLANAKASAGGGEGAYDFGPMFADVEPLLSEPDLTLCHLETPISLDNTDLTQSRVLVFNTPHQIADALSGAGYDGCDFASNHSWDHGLQGLAETRAALEDAGLEYAGPQAQESDAGEPTVYRVGDDITVAQLAYSYTLLNAAGPNDDVPDGAPWLGQYLWPVRGSDGIIADARAARADGADFVVVSMHWGNEYQTEPTEQQRELARELLESGSVDLILGTHAHVIQPCEKINGRYVVYGLGNFLSNQSPLTTDGYLRAATQEGVVVQVDLSREADGSITSEMVYQPTRVQIDDHVIRLATPEQHPATYERTVQTMHSLGEGSCDATPAE